MKKPPAVRRLGEGRLLTRARAYFRGAVLGLLPPVSVCELSMIFPCRAWLRIGSITAGTICLKIKSFS